MRGKIEMSNLEANKKFLIETGLLHKNKKILEIGSGRGSMVNYLRKKGFNITGTEFSANLIKESNELYGNLGIKKMSGEKLLFKENSLDIVISFDVFEHIPNTDVHLQEIKRVLKSGGYYLLQTPNKLTNVPWEIIQYSSLKGNRHEHVSLHTRGQLKRRFKKNGFKIYFIDIPILNDFSLNKIRSKLGRFGVFLVKIFNPDKFPKFLKTNFYVVARNEK